MKKMQSLLERQDKRENSIKNGVGAIASYIDEEMGAFKRQVLHINIDDTSTIETVVPTKGPDGIPGPERLRRRHRSLYPSPNLAYLLGASYPPQDVLVVLCKCLLHTEAFTSSC